MSVEHDLIDSDVKVVEDTTKDKFLTFSIDNEVYGIEIVNITSIIQVEKPVTQVPGNPPYVRGIINLRGDIIPVMDIRARFLKQTRDPDELTCIIVIQDANLLIGLLVDNVQAVETIEKNDILPPPSASANYYNQFIRNIGRTEKGMKLLIDLDRLLMDV